MEKDYLNWTAVSQHDARRQSNPRATNLPFLLLFVLVIVFTFSATLTMAQFEVDGQSTHDAQEDWDDVYAGTSSATVSTGILPDGGGVLSIPEDSYFGGGTKDDNDFDDWEWEFTGTSDKTDLLHGGAVLYGSKIYFFGDRFSNEGATNVGFWFLQSEIGLVQPVGNGTGSFTGLHQIGDILVVAKIEQGGVVGNPAAFKWVGAGNGTEPSDTKSLIPLTVDASTLFSIVNTNTLTVPWQYQGKDINDPLLGNGKIPPVAFFEGFIDLAALHLTTNACFSSFLIETRASPSVSSILEDFLLGSFDVRPDVSVNNAQVCPGGTTTLTANVDGGVGTLAYAWTASNGGHIVGAADGASITVDATGTYQVIVTGASIDGNGTCASFPATANVTNYPTPAVSALATPVSCVGSSDGTIVATGSGGSGGGYQYKIGNGAYQTSGTFTGLAPAVYTITVQDGNGCTGTTTATVLPATPLSAYATPTPITCNTAEGPSNNGTINLIISSPGAGGWTFDWTRQGSPTIIAHTEDLSNLAAGTYNVLVTDSKGCTTTASATVLPATLLSVTAVATPVRCNDRNGLSNDGTVVLTINSPGAGLAGLTYAWTRVGGGYAAATKDISNLAAGTYNVLVTDANGCTATASAIVQPAVLLSVSALATPVRCNDRNGLSNDGTVVLTINSAGAGLAGLTYAWTRVGGGYAAATKDISNLAAGTYNVLVTDAKGCTATASATVQPATLLSVSAVATPVLCNNGSPSNDGTIVLTINSAGAGIGGLTYAWTRAGGGYAAATKDISNLAAGTYNVLVTDSKGCTAVASATVQPATLISVSVIGTINCALGPNGLPSGKISVSGSGYSKLELYNATTNVKVAEQNTSATYDFTALASGSYYVKAYAANSLGVANTCSAQSPVAIVPRCYWLDIAKVTQGVVDPTRDWTFKIYNGPDGHGSGALASATTLGDADGVLNFNYLNLDPTKTYTICEELMAAGWTAVWVTDVNGSSTVLMTYNPDGDKTPPEDLGNRCFDIGAGTAYPLIANGTVRIRVDNTYPGGTARTPGYWKNWNRCTGGGQAANAARQGGWQNGYWLLEDVLANPGVKIGNVTVLTCADGVKILDQRDLKTNKKMASDAAYTLAMHLMAFKLNQAAGAYSCAAATDAAMKADALLISINYTGYGSYLKSSNPLYAKALKLAALLDDYNNNTLDPTECSIISNFTVSEAEIVTPSGSGIITDNYPNPFENRTQIRFMVPERTHTVVQVMSMTGVQLKTLFDDEAEGNQWYEVEFDASSLSKQLYIYRIITDKGIETGKLIQK
jgi:SprB repeat